MIDWSSYRTADRRVSAYISNPAELDTVERCAYYDKAAARYIAEMEAEIEEMKQYRAAVYERMRKLYSTPCTLKITLDREKRWNDKVIYHLNIWQVPIDPTMKPQLIETTKYAGTERAAAIKAYKSAVKAHPGVDCELNIAKDRWER